MRKTAKRFLALAVSVLFVTAFAMPASAAANAAAGPAPASDGIPAPASSAVWPEGAVQVAAFNTDNGGSIRVVEFNVTPDAAADGSVIGIADTNKDGFAISIRIQGGYFYGPVATQPFSAAVSGKTYHFKVMINLPAGTYDVYVTEQFNGSADFSVPGGTPQRVTADNPIAPGTELVDVGGVYVVGGAAVTGARLIQSSFISSYTGVNTSIYPAFCHQLESDNTAAETVYEFDLAVSPASLDCAIGLVDGAVNITAYGNIRYIFHTAGSSIIPYNGTGYAASGIPVTADTPYHIKLALHQATKTYDMWVTPMAGSQAGNTVRVANNFRGRTSSDTTSPGNNVNQLMIDASDGTGIMSNALMLYGDQLQAAVAAVNGADAAGMEAALQSTSLGLSMALYKPLSQASKDEVIAAMLAQAPYPDDIAIRYAFERLVRARTQNPAPPSNLNVDLYPKTNQATITWALSPDGAAIDLYEVGRSVGPVFDPNNYALISTVYGSSASNSSDSGLEANTEYTYAVRARSIVGLYSDWSAGFTVTSGDKPFMPFDTNLVVSALKQPPVKFYLQAYNAQGYFTNPTPNPVVDGVPAPQYAMGEWGQAGKSSSEAFQYLASVCSVAPDFMAPDGTTVEERVLQHIRSIIAGGNEWGCSGTGLSAQGYSPAVIGLTIVKLQAPATWNKLTAAEKAKIDLLMEATLIGAHYASADANFKYNGVGLSPAPVLWAYRTDLPAATTGVDQTGNYDREWNLNHRIGVLTAVAAYYYFGGADGGSAYCNNVLSTFDYDAFRQELLDAGLTNVYAIFGNAGNAASGSLAQINLQTRTRSSSVYTGGYKYYGYSMDEMGQWLNQFITVSLTGGPIRPYGADTVKPSLAPLVQSYPPYNASTSIYRPFGYPGFLDDVGDALLNFPNLGAPGMQAEFDTSDGGDPNNGGPDKAASGARSSVGYVSEGLPAVVNAFYMLFSFDGLNSDGTAVAGIPIADYSDMVVQTVAGMEDFLYKADIGYQGYHKGFFRPNETRPTAPGLIMYTIDVWDNVIDRPVAKIDAVNNAGSVAQMKAALEDPLLGLVLFQYDGLSAAGRNAVAQTMYGLVAGGAKYVFKADIQAALAGAVAVEAVKEFNALIKTSGVTKEQVLAALNVNLGPKANMTAASYVPNALGIFVYGFSDVYTYQTAAGQSTRLRVSQYLIDNAPAGGYADKRAIRDEIIAALADSMPPEIKAVNAAQTNEAMLAALTNPALGLDLTAFNKLTATYLLLASGDVISVRPANGYAAAADIQKTLNTAVAARYQDQLLAAVNGAATAADMAAALTNADFGLNLNAYNALSAADKLVAAQKMIDGAPYASKAAVQTALGAAVNAANPDINLPVTALFDAARGDAAVSLDGGGGTPANASVNLGNNNWANFKTDPLITMQYTRAGYIKLDLSSYADLTADSLVDLTVRINIAAADFSQDPTLGGAAHMALYPCADTSQTQYTATYSNVIAGQAAFGTGQAAGWRPVPASNVVDYSSTGFYNFDVTAYVRAQLAAGNTKVAFVLAHTHTLQSTHQFSPLPAAANIRPQYVLTTRYVAPPAAYTVTADAGSTTPSLTLTLEKDVLIDASEAALDGGLTGAVMAGLTRISGNTYRIGISNVRRAGPVSVTVTNPGVDGAAHGVTIACADPAADITYTAAANGDAAMISTNKITLTFSEPVPMLKAADVSLNGQATGAVMGALAKVSDTQYTLAVSGITQSGAVSVTVSLQGVSPAPVTVGVVYSSVLPPNYTKIPATGPLPPALVTSLNGVPVQPGVALNQMSLDHGSVWYDNFANSAGASSASIDRWNTNYPANQDMSHGLLGMKTAPASANTTYYLQKGMMNPDGALMAESKFMIPEDWTADSAIWYGANLSGGSSANGRLYTVRHENGVYNIYFGNQTANPVASVNAGEWVTVKAAIEPNRAASTLMTMWSGSAMTLIVTNGAGTVWRAGTVNIAFVNPVFTAGVQTAGWGLNRDSLSLGYSVYIPANKTALVQMGYTDVYGIVNNNVPEPQIAYTAVSDAAEGGMTSKLTLTFNNPMPGLKASDVALNPGATGAVKGTLKAVDADGKVYDLAIGSVSASGTVAVTVGKYAASHAPVSAAVYFPSDYVIVTETLAASVGVELRTNNDADINTNFGTQAIGYLRGDAGFTHVNWINFTYPRLGYFVFDLSSLQGIDPNSLRSFTVGINMLSVDAAQVGKTLALIEYRGPMIAQNAATYQNVIRSGYASGYVSQPASALASNVIGSAGLYKFDVTAYVLQALSAGKTQVSFILGTMEGETGYGTFATVMHADPALRPAATVVMAAQKTPEAAVPEIITQPAGYTQVTAGDNVTLSVEAAVSDGGNLSYQWRSCDANGQNGAAIAGASGASYSFAAGEAGTFYYYVTVTNTLNGATASIDSYAAAVSVSPKPADKTALNDLIAKVEGIYAANGFGSYTAANAAALLDALAAAKAVSGDAAASQEATDAALAALQAALDKAAAVPAALVCSVKSMAVKIGKPLAIPFEWDGAGALVFTSSNAAVCGVSQAGVLTPLKAGIAVITITKPDKTSYVFAVTVTV